MKTWRLRSRLFLVIILLSLFVLVPLMNAQALSIILNFEGLADGEPILNFYDGGLGGFGTGPGPDFDIIFGPDALAIIDADSGGSGNFANEPSSDTIAFFLTGPGVIMNVPNGFTTGFSFYYTSSRVGSVTVYDGLDGTGNVLATVPVFINWTACGASGDPTGEFACWDPVGVSFTGTAKSVNFSGVANQVGFDEITLGSVIPGNLPPVADANGPYSGDEGSAINLDGTGSSDPVGDPLIYSWSIDSGLCSFDDAASPTPQLTCTDQGNFTVTLVVDNGQAADSDTAAVSVSNVAPTVSIDGVNLTPVTVGEDVTVTGSFTDPGTNDTHTAVWDWGDGTAAGTVSGLNVGPDSHAYSTAGIYPIGLEVTDDDGGVGTATFNYVVVYDPGAGFVTGGGWIDSQLGAYKPDPLLTGKATFGFVAKYKKDATMPDGSTEFQFHAGDLNFHISSYDWLMVTGSNYARFKGIGTINGEHGYKFMIWAGDGDPDTFRIKIWTEDEFDVETLVYDNGMDQAIAGGSIVVHTKK